MKFSEPPLRKTEPGVQCLQKRAADINSFQREWPDGIYHVLIHSSRIVPVHLLRIREGIVLCDIYELDGIKVTGSVNSAGARSLVAIKNVFIQQYCACYLVPLPEVIPFVALFVFHLLVEGETHCLLSHTKHSLRLCICTVVLQAYNGHN